MISAIYNRIVSISPSTKILFLFDELSIIVFMCYDFLNLFEIHFVILLEKHNLYAILFVHWIQARQ